MGTITAKSTAAENTNSQKAYQTKQTASKATAKALVHAKSSFSGLFWFTTLATTIIIQTLLKLFLLPGIYSAVFDNEILVNIGIIGSLISGVVGTLIFNAYWAPGRKRGTYAWWEYILSILTGFGFTIGFGIAMSLIVLAIYILFYLLVGAFIIVIIAGLVSGG